MYNAAADAWWSDRHRWLRTLRNLVPARFRHFDPVMGSWDGLEVLEVGCGGGFMAEALAQRGARVCALDPADRAIAAARAHARQSDLDIDYRVGTGESLPWPDQSFDAVVCVDVLEHVSDLDQVLREITRVLRPGGHFLFDTINRTPLARFVIVFLGEYVMRMLPQGTHDGALFIPPEVMHKKLAVLGFEVGRFVGLGPTGMNWRGDLTFGLLPTTQINYIGTAVLPRREGGGHAPYA